jgi:FkbM family methyltransferase
VTWLFSPVTRAVRTIKHLRDITSAIGPLAGFRFWLHRAFSHRIERIHPKSVNHSLQVRAGSSDIDNFRQVFVLREYRCLDDMTDVDLIIDRGAYVGYSSAYFLSRFPNCRVLAIEPDASNFAALQRNTAPYGDRIECIQAGVWSDPTRMVVVSGDRREWGRQVRPDADGPVVGIDIWSLLAHAGRDRISLLKVDVEGAEAVIFAENHGWLDLVDAITIELHDDSAFGSTSNVVLDALNDHRFELFRSGELTVGRRAPS